MRQQVRHDLFVLVPGRWRYEKSWLARLSTTELYRVVSGLAFRLEYTQAPDELLSSVSELVATELRLPYVLIEIEHSAWGEGRAAYGEPVGRELALPLTYQGYPAGRLVVSGRRPGLDVGRRDRRVVIDLPPPRRAAPHPPPALGGLPP